MNDLIEQLTQLEKYLSDALDLAHPLTPLEWTARGAENRHNLARILDAASGLVRDIIDSLAKAGVAA